MRIPMDWGKIEITWIGLLCILMVVIVVIICIIIFFVYLCKCTPKKAKCDLEAPEISADVDIQLTKTLEPTGRHLADSTTSSDTNSDVIFKSEDKCTTEREFQDYGRIPISTKSRSLSQSQNEPRVIVDDAESISDINCLNPADDSKGTSQNGNSVAAVLSNANKVAIPHQRDVIDVKAKGRMKLNPITQERDILNFIQQIKQDSLLVIAADATPDRVGGYCVNLKENYCETYSLFKDEIPWAYNRKHSSEFEMKNLMFAIMLWQNTIQKYRRCRIYTDHSVIKSRKNIFGKAARKLLRHCTSRSGLNAILVNEDEVFCNRGKNLFQSKIFIRPADDLSRGRQDKCERSLNHYYGIPMENFRMFKLESESLLGICRQISFHIPNLATHFLPNGVEISSESKHLTRYSNLNFMHRPQGTHYH